MSNFQAGWTATAGSPPSIDSSTTPFAKNPFGFAGASPTFVFTTPRDLIDSARIRHWAFSDLAMPDGAALLYLNQRQREHLAAAGAEIEGVVGTTVQYTVSRTLPGNLITFTNGVPTTAASGADGWVVHVDADGIPFVDNTEPMIAADPLQANGGVPGFPLPKEMVRLVNVMLIYGSGSFVPCALTNERHRVRALPGRDPVAFISGNRLVPMLPTSGTATNTGDRWQNVTGIQISYVGIDTLRTLDDAVALPTVLTGLLVADVAALMAAQSPRLTLAEKQFFTQQAQRMAGEFANISLNLLESPTGDSVHYMG